MTIEEIKLLCDKATVDGLMYEQDSVLLNTEEGANHAALAVLGTLLINMGKPTFSKYLDVQVASLGWIAHHSNVITDFAYNIRKSYKANESIPKSLFEDAEQVFINPIIESHTQSGGASITPKQKEALCAMLIAKIAWDANLGNMDLTKHIRMLDDSFLKQVEARFKVK